MTIPNNYYVNVAKDGRWYCTIELGDVLPETAESKFREILGRFDGFKCTLFHTVCNSKLVG